MNICRYWDMKKYCRNARIIEYLTDEIVIIDFGILDKLNKKYEWWKPLKQANGIQKWLSFTNEPTQIIIPMNVIKWYRDMDTDSIRGSAFITNKNKLIGFIMFQWYNNESGPGKWMYSPLCSESNERITVSVLVARGLCSNPMLIDDINLKQRDGIKYVKQINQTYMNKQEGVQPCTSNQTYECGICINELYCSFCGDLKELCNCGGLSGGSSNYPCPWCLIPLANLKSNPTPNNRRCKARQYDQTIKLLNDAKRGLNGKTGNFVQSYGVKYAPICYFEPIFWSFPVVHIAGGQGGRILWALKTLILTEHTNSEVMKKWQNLNKKLYELQSELDLFQHELDLKTHIYAENLKEESETPEHRTDLFRAHTDPSTNNSESFRIFNNDYNEPIDSLDNILNYSDDCNHMNEPVDKGICNNCDNESDILEGKNSIDDINVTTCQNPTNTDSLDIEPIDLEVISNASDESNVSLGDIADVNQKITHIESQINDCINEINQLELNFDQNNNRWIIWNKILQRLEIKSLSYRVNELTGPNGLKLINNYRKIIPLIKQVSPQTAEIAEYMFPIRKFLVHSMCHKNKEPLSDIFIYGHKYATIVDGSLYRLFIKSCVGVDLQAQHAVGLKQHINYHIHSKMEYTRATPAHLDDQLPENVCKKQKGSFRHNRNRVNKVTMRSMNLRMNCEHSMRFDEQNNV